MLSEGNIFHIYNRANGFEDLFREERNYEFFLQKLYEHIVPVAEIFAWCLLADHFHLMIRIRQKDDVEEHLGTEALQKAGSLEKLCSKRFSNFFSSYAQAYNKVYNRRGSLFQSNMKQKQVINLVYYKHLLLYIHHNAAKHGFVHDFNDWPHSSWFQYLEEGQEEASDNSCLITAGIKTEVFGWFVNRKAFIDAHHQTLPYRSVFD